MKKPKYIPTYQGNFIHGKFEKIADANGEWICRSPADFSDEIGRIQYSYAAVEKVVQSARTAFPSWKRKKTTDRADFLKKYQAAIKRKEDELIEAISREIGKPL